MYPIIIFILISAKSISAEEALYENSSCGNWTAFKDEKCYELFKHVASYTDAMNYCHQNDIVSTLLLIKTKEEQDAIVGLLKANDVADNVWTGITKVNGIFKNYDQSELYFKNWAENRPFVNKTGYDCVEISTDDANYGKWVDEKCQKQNAILCEKIQPWSSFRLQTILIDLKREHEKRIDDMNNQLSKQKERIFSLEKNPVPIGFIYTQALGQKEPKMLWPNTEWENISPKLAGLFFRVEGGQAAEYGKIQEQQTQSIEVMKRLLGQYISDPLTKTIKISTEFQNLLTGRDDGEGNNYNYHDFKHNNEEIRPINSAVRVWQRIK